MAKAGYSAVAATTFALAAAGTARTVVGVLAPAQFGVDLQGFSFSFDGVTATTPPILCELCRATFVSNAPGTASTSITPLQEYGPTITPGFTAAANWTTEPTVLTVLWPFTVDPNKGLFVYDRPPGRTWDTAVSVGLAIRMTLPTGGSPVPNVRPSLFFERT